MHFFIILQYFFIIYFLTKYWHNNRPFFLLETNGKIMLEILVPTQAPLSEQAYNALRMDILSGGILPGAQLKLDKLKKDYGFSSSPLREALNRLVSEGMVTTEGKRGFFAATVSKKEFEDISRLMLLLDAMALQEAIEMGDDAWEGSVLSAFHQLERCEGRLASGISYSSDVEWATRYNSFFAALFSACSSPQLMQIRSALFQHSERYRLIAARAKPDKKSKLGELKKLINATVDREMQKAGNILKNHLEQMAAPVIKYVSQMK